MHLISALPQMTPGNVFTTESNSSGRSGVAYHTFNGHTFNVAMTLILRLVILCLLLTSVINHTHAGLLDRLNAPSSFLPVEEAFQVDSVILEDNAATANVSVQWSMADGYYLYQHKFYLTFSGIDGQYLGKSFNPQGIDKSDDAFGDVIAHYRSVQVMFALPEKWQNQSVTLNYQGCADAGLCYPPQRLNITNQLLNQASAAHNDSSTSQNLGANSIPNADPNFDQSGISEDDIRTDVENPAKLTTLSDKTSKPSSVTTLEQDFLIDQNNWVWSLLLFFAMGLGLTFTPCVLPMVPILSSIVVGQREHSSRLGFILSLSYVTGMALTYAAAGTLVGMLGAEMNLQSAMQSPPVLITFAALFVLLAFSMFGVYELRLPSGLQARLSNLQQQQKGGQLASVFLMGALSALVVSPCISAPLAGALVYLSATGDALLGGSALLALGFGMGVPLIVLATTGSRLLPKSGPWMNHVKVFFGVLLLLVAVWLLERLLDAHWILLMVGVICFLYGIALGGLTHSEKTQDTPSNRLEKGCSWLLMIYGVSAIIGGLQGNERLTMPLVSQPKSMVYETPFTRYTDVDGLIDDINAATQPVVVDLYADWCISCKVMERDVFSNADVQNATDHIRWLQLDVTNNTEAHVAFMNQHGVFGPPALILFNNGNEIVSGRFMGEMDANQFVRHLLDHFPAN